MSGSKNDPASVHRQPTGHREPPSTHEPTQRTKSFPAEDANANQAYFAMAKAPNRHSKPLGSATPGVSLNKPTKQFDASRFQRAGR